MDVLPASLARLVDQQLGVIARHQLVRKLSEDTVDGLVRRGRLVPIQRGVYRAAWGAVVPQQAAFAAALRLRPGATLTGPAVLGHLRVDGYDPDGPFEVLVPPDRSVWAAVDFPWRVDPRPDREVTTCGEVRLALAQDALVHSVAWRHELGDRTLKLGHDWLGWHDEIDREAFLAALVRRAPTDPLAAELLELLGGEVLARCESDGERQVGALACCFDPAPEPQVQVTPRRRADWYFRLLRLVLEYLGSVDHDTAAGRAADAERDAELRAAGIAVHHVTAADLRDEAALIGRLVALVVARAAELDVPAPTFDLSRRP